jgi:hypothetical protein
MIVASPARTAFLLFGISLLAAACSKGDKPVDYQQPAAPAQPVPVKFAVTDFRKMAWLEGNWRGRQNDTTFFYETYHIVDDSTMLQGTFTDSTFKVKSDSAMIAIRGDQILDGGRTPWHATKVDSASVEFQRPNAKDFFVWTRETPDRWIARIHAFPRDSGEKVIVYPMERVKPAASKPAATKPAATKRK